MKSFSACIFRVWTFLVVPLVAIAAPGVNGAHLHEDAMAQVVPDRGFQSRVVLGDSMVKLAREGVIDAKKLAAVYAPRGGLPEDLRGMLTMSSVAPMLLTSKNAALYVNILWALGLANHMETNDASPLYGPSRDSFASTGGWTLGRAANGGAYFNRFPIVALTPQQEALVTRVAQHSFRPCCDNSTFFQDCNHGSALLGLLALGASQGLNEGELFREALAFNSFWFPQQYAQIAIYFNVVKGVAWRDVDPSVVLSETYSSAGGWGRNVARELQARGLLPQRGGSDCSV